MSQDSAPTSAAAPPDEAQEDKRLGRQDIIAGVTLAVFAAALAICDLGAGKYGDDEILAANEKAAAYAWFQSKSVKQSLVEGQSQLMQDLLSAKAIQPQLEVAIRGHVAKLDKQSQKYEAQKKEILLGSKAVGEGHYAQDLDGVMGKIVGAKEWEAKSEGLAKSGDVFDLGTLFLQLCLVMGAIGIVMTGLTAKRLFYVAMVLGGLVGCYFTWAAYGLAWAVPA